MSLKIKNVLTCRDCYKIKEIYLSSFPKKERMPFFLMNIMSILWNTKFLAFYDEDIPCGLLYLANIGKTIFIMFFAVDEKLRSLGYGSQILQSISEKYPQKKIIISIEPCDINAIDIELRQRRKAFYLRNGYQETGYMMKLSGQVQEILIKNGVFNKTSFIIFFILYSNLTNIPKIFLKK